MAVEWGSIINVGLQAVGGLMQANSQNKAGQESSAISQANAANFDFMAKDTIDRGYINANNLRMKGRRLRGSQRVAYSAGNIDSASGTASDVQAATAANVEFDAQVMNINAQREAMGYTMRADEARRTAQISKTAGKTSAVNSLIGTAASVYSTGYKAGWWGT